MKSDPDPSKWIVPDWHPDWGDAALELNHLRVFAQAMTASQQHLSVSLIVAEPGLMYVQILRGERVVLECYSVVPIENTPAQRRYGLFFFPNCDQEEEIYAESVEEAMKIACRLL